jgi:hypothetical protein
MYILGPKIYETHLEDGDGRMGLPWMHALVPTEPCQAAAAWSHVLS